jgi:hypothetical protein
MLDFGQARLSIHRPRRTSLFVFVVGALFFEPAAEAATRTWTGLGADNNWSTAANWGGVAPSAGDDLMFPGGTPRLSPNNDFAANTSFNTISFTGSSGGYTLGGNAIQIVSGISAANSVGTNTVSLAVTLTASQTLSCTIAGPLDRLVISGTVALGSFTLTLSAASGSVIEQDGAISGTGGVTVSGSGVAFLNSPCSYSGPTNITGGSFLAVSLNTASVVTVSAGLLQFANGDTVGPVTVNSGAQIYCGGGGSNQIGNVTSLTLQSGSHLNMSLYSVSNYGQLNASGPVSLGGAILDLGWAFTSSTGNAFTIINNTGVGAITGTFSSLPEGATFTQNGRNYQITYIGGSGNDAVVTDIGAAPAATPTPTPPGPSSAVVPTLGTGGLVAFAGLVALTALFVLRRPRA